MSLRLRLTLLYTSLLGGVLLIFGSLLYGLVTAMLLNQLDSSLLAASEQLTSRLLINSSGQFDLRSLTSFQPDADLEFQVWNANRELQIARPLRLKMALDPNALASGGNKISTAQNGSRRVLTIPLKSERGPAGVLQLAYNLNLLRLTQNTLAIALMVMVVVGMLIAGLAAWLVTGQALAPLATVTDVATQITRADDLQRRIPLAGSGQDEVGQLIRAFNQTLERLEKLFNSQRRFIADISHELRTPLTVIKGNVGLMRRLKQIDEESLSSIENEVDRLTRMVGDLLLLAQAESGRLPMDRSPVELDTILLEVFQQVRLLASDRLTIRLADIDQVQVLGDRDRLKQVLLNLGGNAVQYTPAGGEVNLALRRVGDQVQVIVSDTGPGISAEDQAHIFERFYRSEKSRKRGPGTGYGLGLSIAYWIVHHHGGRIEVTSQEGRGTTFCVWLPAIPNTVIEPH